MAELAGLEKLLSRSEESALQQAPTSYGCDAPVSFTGPTPGVIGPLRKKPKEVPPPKPRERDAAAIWQEAELQDAGHLDDPDDGRRQPEYAIVYKQKVSPEDMFLGIDPLRHAGISDAIVLETRLADIALDVRQSFVRVLAPSYQLKAYLPERVDEQKGDAKWDAAKGLLTLTLPIISTFESKMSSSREID